MNKRLIILAPSYTSQVSSDGANAPSSCEARLATHSRCVAVRFFPLTFPLLAPSVTHHATRRRLERTPSAFRQRSCRSSRLACRCFATSMPSPSMKRCRRTQPSKRATPFLKACGLRPRCGQVHADKRESAGCDSFARNLYK